MPTIALQNLGCAKNVIDGERIAHLFTSGDYTITDCFSQAEVIIVNTCAFIREAQEEAIEAILEAASFKKNGACRLLVVAGCFSQRYKARVKKDFPEVDLWVGVHDWEPQILKVIQKAVTPSFKRELGGPIATQHLKIAEGCSHGCTYCVIPRIRGHYESRPIPEIITEAQWLEAQGVRELILVAQDTTSYGKETGTTLVGLLEKLLAATSFPWVRLMYLHPSHVDDALINLFAAEKRLCPYFDLPLQHIADPILKTMNRRPLSGKIQELIDKIRDRVPHAALRSTFIIGFPGETGAHFGRLVDFVEKIRFDKLGVFPFSPEEGTHASTLRGRPRLSTVMKRCETVMLAQREISRELLASRIGETLEVIIEGPSEDPSYSFRGRTRFDAPEIDGTVFIEKGKKSPGVFELVKITAANDYDLFGEFA